MILPQNTLPLSLASVAPDKKKCIFVSYTFTMTLSFEELKDEMKRVLLGHGFAPEKAEICAHIFAENSRDGVHSHGINRFPLFVQYIQEGLVSVENEPVEVGRSGLIEHWDGQLAPGMYTATRAMQRAIAGAKASGMGCVAVRNTNHWMRGGTYGWQAAEQGCIGICATNARANMPPWGGTVPRLGNNPLVIAVPRKSGHLVLDMALSQFSYGKMQEYEMAGRPLPVAGGYDQDGQLSHEPAAIAATKRTLPIGYWKGSGLSLMIDVLVSALSGGRSVAQITKEGKEYGVSQFFLCLQPDTFQEEALDEIIAFTKTASEQEGSIRYPGEQVLRQRQKSDQKGIEVNAAVWEKVKNL
jgi:3-dehydro-L-gulonate 2-dehydrogenase